MTDAREKQCLINLMRDVKTVDDRAEKYALYHWGLPHQTEEETADEWEQRADIIALEKGTYRDVALFERQSLIAEIGDKASSFFAKNMGEVMTPAKWDEFKQILRELEGES